MTSSEEPAGIEAPFTIYVSVPLKPSKKTSPVIPVDDVLDKVIPITILSKAVDPAPAGTV